MYFKITFSNGYCGCDEEIYIEATTEREAEEYGSEYLVNCYSFYDDASQCLNDIEDYPSEEEYWEDFNEYQAECSYFVEEISKEEYDEYAPLE